MQLLNDKMTKVIILAVAACAVLMVLNMNTKRVGKQVALVGSGVTVLVALFLGHQLMQEDEEGFYVGDYDPSEGNYGEVGAKETGDDGAVKAAQDLLDDNNSEEVVDNTQEEAGGVRGWDERKNDVHGEDVPSVADDNRKPRECLPRAVLNPEELLPSANSPNNWDTPANPGNIQGANFLDAGYHIGINTVGQTLRNANRQLRSDPPNPQVKVSPWMQSTIEPDTNRLPLEIGQGSA